MTNEDFPILTLDLRQGQKFPLGQVVITQSALDALPPGEVRQALARHASGDWGELCDDDVEVAEVAWVPLAELESRLAYADERRLIRRATELLLDSA